MMDQSDRTARNQVGQQRVEGGQAQAVDHRHRIRRQRLPCGPSLHDGEPGGLVARLAQRREEPVVVVLAARKAFWRQRGRTARCASAGLGGDGEGAPRHPSAAHGEDGTPAPRGGREPPAQPPEEPEKPKEIGGPAGPEPTRFGDWERKGRCIDF